MKKSLLLSSILLFVFLASCKKEEETTPMQQLEGTWRISNTNLLGQNVAGDGSYLKFIACDLSTCSGEDYDALPSPTTGTFTYSLQSDNTILAITDPSSDGGNYNASWKIETFTKTRLKISNDTGLFGVMTIDLEKQ